MNQSSRPITRKAILQKAWPIILANAAVPTLGLVDTAVVGHLGNSAQLGAIALGAIIFSFVYWSFGFLRMGTTGFAAQAAGAGDEAEVRATLARALSIAAVAGVSLIVLQWPVGQVAFFLLDGSSEVEALARDYFFIRIWGAPATLATFALVGVLIGLGYSRTLLALQILLNGLNIGLDVYFAGVLEMGARGIALGTALAEWTTCIIATAFIFRMFRRRRRDKEALWSWPRVLHTGKLKHTLAANTDILIRTLTLVFAFAWFANQSARFGDTTLAANHILLQLISFSAFFLDGFAFVVESLVGSALGSRRGDQFRAAVMKSTQLAVATAAVLALAILALGDLAVAALTDLVAIRGAAEALLPWCALYVVVAVGAFQLDGVFIGATRTREMRNASIVSISVFLLSGWPLIHWFGNVGLWWAFIIYVVFRALSLAWYYPRISRSLN